MAIKDLFSRRQSKSRNEEELLEVNVMDTEDRNVGRLGIKIAKLENTKLCKKIKLNSKDYIIYRLLYHYLTV